MKDVKQLAILLSDTPYYALFDLVEPLYSDDLAKVLFCSPFIADLWLINNQWCIDFFTYHNQAVWQLSDFEYSGYDEEVFMQTIRQWRMQQMSIIAARDLLGIDSTEVTCSHISQLADQAIIAAQSFAISNTLSHTKYINKISEQDIPSFMTLGMGKLGGYELNYSSDIDVMFFYDDPKVHVDGVEWPVFFTHIAQKIIKYIGSTTAEGFVFRVDVRLRPFGDSGALVLSLAAVENYYTTHGRDWERYALIKARIITGSAEAKQALQLVLQPFIYRRYLDFSALDALRDLKSRIVSSYSESKMQGNIKLGRGGIREVEFVFQLLQLTYGGKEPDLRTPSLVSAATTMCKKALIAKADIDDLLDAYWFLRKVENSLQIMRDQQVHHLPTLSEDQDRLALAIGYESYTEFLSVLERHQLLVMQNFDAFLYADQSCSDNTLEQGKFIWLNADNEAGLVKAQQISYPHAEFLLEQLSLLKGASVIRRMSQTARERLDAFIPLLLLQLVKVQGYDEHAEVLWKRLQFFIRQIALRSAYLVMLTERPEALGSLLGLMVKSAWVSDSISQHPAMIDILLEPLVGNSFSHSALLAALDSQLQYADDIESHMQFMRNFKHETMMKVANADLNHALPLMQVSDSLTALAECLLASSLDLAKQPLIELYGEPVYFDNTEQLITADMAVIAYGKMGGYELGYDSDLDIVFLHSSQGKKEYTNGDKPIDNTTFFARWVQKTLHYLNTLTHNGRLYEVDMRLRPNGTSGTLATRIQGFELYLQREAWLWELQALVRARFVAGNAELGERFENIRKNTLCQVRDVTKVKTDVVDMRLRMRKELGSKVLRNTSKGVYQSIKSEKLTQFDLKHDFGGIADIEFMVQYAVLANAAKTPALANYTDNIRLLELMGENGYLSERDAQSLIAAYQLFRQTIHHRSLQNQGRKVMDISAELADAIDAVSVIWLNIMN